MSVVVVVVNVVVDLADRAAVAVHTVHDVGMLDEAELGERARVSLGGSGWVVHVTHLGWIGDRSDFQRARLFGRRHQVASESTGTVNATNVGEVGIVHLVLTTTLPIVEVR